MLLRICCFFSIIPQFVPFLILERVQRATHGLGLLLHVHETAAEFAVGLAERSFGINAIVVGQFDGDEQQVADFLEAMLF